ncbi:ABC transporter permease [Acidisphaera sp. S103]|uniref:ABC transporter permease n=1 Tax=Acidisphaera sp. S103 TaxID=1747223 RepID=UPI00131DA58E|nr:ABC transporter permease [Acidisphaera sp. S103]
MVASRLLKEAPGTERGPHWLLLAPNLAWLLLFMVGPLSLLAVISFKTYEPGRGILNMWQLGNYAKFLTDPFYLGVLGSTLVTGACVTALTLLFGFPLAYTLAHTRGWRRSALYIGVLMPLLTSAVVRTFGWMILLGNNGFINRTLLQWAWIDHPLRLMYNLSGVVIALTEVLLPFMVLALDAALLNIDPSVVEAARNVGGSRMRVFFSITLPLAVPGIVSGSILVFSLSISAFVTPSLIGGAQVRLMPTVIYQQAMALLDWPFGAAIAFIMLVAIALLLIPALTLVERRSRLA